MENVITAGSIRLHQKPDGTLRVTYTAPGKEAFGMQLDLHMLEAWAKREMRKALFAPADVLPKS
jgi:hypothetical protein